MPHETSADPEALVVLLYGERHLGAACPRLRVHTEVSGSADDNLVLPRPDRHQQGDVPLEVHVCDLPQFLVADVPLVAEEATIHSLTIQPLKGAPDLGPITGTNRSNGHLCAVLQSLLMGIGFHCGA